MPRNDCTSLELFCSPVGRFTHFGVEETSLLAFYMTPSPFLPPRGFFPVGSVCPGLTVLCLAVVFFRLWVCFLRKECLSFPSMLLPVCSFNSLSPPLFFFIFGLPIGPPPVLTPPLLPRNRSLPRWLCWQPPAAGSSLPMRTPTAPRASKVGAASWTSQLPLLR